jgi:hypothetical protein
MYVPLTWTARRVSPGPLAVAREEVVAGGIGRTTWVQRALEAMKASYRKVLRLTSTF